MLQGGGAQGEPRTDDVEGGLTVYALLIIALLFPSLAHAQPELKVGQEVEVFYDGAWILCPKIVGFETDFEGFKELVCVNPISPYTNTFHQPLDKADGYRILKPAPRPEFKLPTEAELSDCYTRAGGAVGGNEACHDEWMRKSQRVIADELRFLRKWQDELKKERAELRKEIERLDDESTD